MSINTLGIMSGTSCDGLDLCLATFLPNKNTFDYKIIQTKSYNYSESWQKRLKEAYTSTGDELKTLEFDFSIFQIDCIKAFQSEFPELQIDLISTHGHTVFHRPNIGFTFQMTLGGLIAEKTQITTICNFREQDVFLGGQGAPLVPIGDKLLFSKFEACINLGGFANISFEKNTKRLAYDLCPFNILMNPLANKLGSEFDRAGQYASEGKLIPELKTELDQISYYSTLPPKSLSVENIKTDFQFILDNYTQSPQDILHTLSCHYAHIISKEIKNHKNVLLTGGGVFNNFFVENLKKLSKSEVYIPSKELIEFKEALIFAFLGFLRFTNQVNILSSVTGSRTNHSSGQIYYPIQK